MTIKERLLESIRAMKDYSTHADNREQYFYASGRLMGHCEFLMLTDCGEFKRTIKSMAVLTEVAALLNPRRFGIRERLILDRAEHLISTL